jgi:hypothetical protein
LDCARQGLRNGCQCQCARSGPGIGPVRRRDREGGALKIICLLTIRSTDEAKPTPLLSVGLETEKLFDARAPMRDLLSLAELKALKAKQRKAKDPITREWCAALLEGAKASPWYSDDNMPSLYRDRGMKIAAVAVIAIDKRHGLATEGLQFLRRFHLQLPNTFATLPAVVRDWEAQFSLRVASGCPGEITLRNPEEGAEQNGLNEWLDQHLVRLEKCGIMA